MMDADLPVHEWVEEFPSAVTVCDVNGIIIAMNRASRTNFAGRGGERLLGKSLFDCHSESSAKIIRKMLQKEVAQTYITVDKGNKRLVNQSPWYKNGIFAGLVETIVDIPDGIEMRDRS